MAIKRVVIAYPAEPNYGVNHPNICTICEIGNIQRVNRSSPWSYLDGWLFFLRFGECPQKTTSAAQRRSALISAYSNP